MDIKSYIELINNISELDEVQYSHAQSIDTIVKGLNELLSLSIDLINALNYTNSILEEHNLPQYDLDRRSLRLKELDN